MDSRSAIESAIPHRPPMLLIDAIVEQTDRTIRCEKKFEDSEFFVQGHFPGYPLVPGVILCECCMQAGAILLSALAEGSDSVPVATRMDGVKFKQMVRPGDTVEIEAELKEVVSSAYFMVRQSQGRWKVGRAPRVCLHAGNSQ